MKKKHKTQHKTAQITVTRPSKPSRGVVVLETMPKGLPLRIEIQTLKTMSFRVSRVLLSLSCRLGNNETPINLS